MANRDLHHAVGHDPGLSLSDLPSRGLRHDTQSSPNVVATSAQADIEKGARRVMEKYSPPHLVIDRRQQIVRFSGVAVGDYLEPSSGAPSFALFDILRKPLRPMDRTALQDVQATKAPVRRENIPVRVGSNLRLVTIIAEPMGNDGADAGFIVVGFRMGISRSRHEEGRRRKAAARSDAGHRARASNDPAKPEIKAARPRTYTTLCDTIDPAPGDLNPFDPTKGPITI
jgi:two-component system CheB/CheR fusion protein